MHDRESKFYILPSTAPRDERVNVLKHGDTFGVFDRFGDIHGEHGLFHEDTRFLSEWTLRLQDGPPLLLSSMTHETDPSMIVNLTNPDLELDGKQRLPRGTLHVRRSKFVWRGTCHEHLVVYHYGDTPITLRLRIAFDADFADIFEVRGTRRSARGRVLEPVREDNGFLLKYESLDRMSRALRLTCSEAPSQLRRHELEFSLSLAPGNERDLYFSLACETGSNSNHAVANRASYERSENGLSSRMSQWRDQCCRVSTSSARFSDWMKRCLTDVSMMVTETPQGPYPYAGVPWFSTAFGRDGIITALQMLWINPALAQGVLRFLSVTQATRVDAVRVAEPGKILHEMRRGEMANLGDVPFGHYYGSVDATPLFIMLAGAYYQATADRALIEEIWPAVELALAWMEQFGDKDGDGFLEYTGDPAGLIHQGWKDSADSVFHANGKDAKGPIALCEVQGYAYAAYLSAAELARVLGNKTRSAYLEQQAESLRCAFEEQFWCEELGTYALALDGDKRPCRVRTSNAGHCLYARIASPERAAILARTLLEERSFSGWGIRTVAAGEARYNPMSYHNGSIWPHDNALVAAGLSAYGYPEAALRILFGLTEATLHFQTNRLPELFCGFTRTQGAGPTVYPVACSPQAWASAAPFMLLKACLGLTVDAPRKRVEFSHPTLPPFLQELSIRGLRVGESSVDLMVHRYPEDVGINVLGRSGPVQVVNVK